MFHILFLSLVIATWLGAGFNYALGVGAIYLFMDYRISRRINTTPLEPRKPKGRFR